MIVTTTPSVEGRRITPSNGVVVALVAHGFHKGVLPLEDAAEAQQLVAISLEGSDV